MLQTNCRLLVILISSSVIMSCGVLCAQTSALESRQPQKLPFQSTRQEDRAILTMADSSSVVAEPSTAPRPISQKSSTPLPRQTDDASNNSSHSNSGLRALTTVGASLAMVIGAFLLLVWVLRRGNPKSHRMLPDEVLEVLGRKAMGGRIALQLLRFGDKLVLVAMTAEGAETLTEVSDPEQVERLTKLSRGEDSSDITQSFHEILNSGTESVSLRRERGRI